MNTAIVRKNTELAGMLNLKFIAYLCNPVAILSLLFLDVSGVMAFISKYVFSDMNYLGFLAVVCMIDLITGVWKVIVNQGIKGVTSKGLRDTVTKIISYGSFLVLVHVLTHFQINGIVSPVYTWLNKVALEFLIMIEVKSVYENIVEVNPKLDFIDAIFQKIVDSIKNKKNVTK